MTGAMTGHAITMALSGLVIYVTGSYETLFAMSAAFSLGGLAVIALLDSTSHVLIPDWEDALPAEARSIPAVAAPAPAD